MADAEKIIAGRDFLAYTAPWAASNATPADTIAYGTAWGAPYVDKGYTEGGLHFSVGVDYTDIRVDQELDPVLKIGSGRDLRMSTILAQFTVENLKEALGQGTITTVAAGAGTRGHDDLDIGSTININHLTVGFDIKHPGDSEAVRVIGWKTLVQGSPTLDFTPDAKAQIPLEVQCLPDTSATPTRIMKIRDVVPAI